MINLPNIDGLIWNIEYRIADILKEFDQTKKIDIDLNQEIIEKEEID